ncbi:hypothetical protein ACFFRR_011449 [Megaselia abdita]
MKNFLSIVVLLGVFAFNNAKVIDPCLEISGNVAVAFVGDCRRYWRCYDKQPGKVNMCAKGTYFNPKKSFCTTDNSFCHMYEERIEHPIKKPLLVVPTPKTVTFAPPPSFEVTVPGTYGICSSCNGQPKGWLVPVIGDCGKYCVCDTYDSKNALIMKNCPSNLYFNPTKRVCDWPLASGCSQTINAKKQKRVDVKEKVEVNEHDNRLLQFIYQALYGNRRT